MISPRRPAKAKTSRILRSAKTSGKLRAAKDRTASPLDRRQEALREKEEQLKQATEQLKQLIEEAPRRREEQVRRRREELAGDVRLPSRASLADKRFDSFAVANPAIGKRRLRSEKRDGKLFFVFLCVVFGGLLIWIYQLIWAYLQHM